MSFVWIRFHLPKGKNQFWIKLSNNILNQTDQVKAICYHFVKMVVQMLYSYSYHSHFDEFDGRFNCKAWILLNIFRDRFFLLRRAMPLFYTFTRLLMVLCILCSIRKEKKTGCVFCIEMGILSLKLMFSFAGACVWIQNMYEHIVTAYMKLKNCAAFQSGCDLLHLRFISQPALKSVTISLDYFHFSEKWLPSLQLN